MEEYKGIYYRDNSEKKFFEGGAHFKYIKLYQRLEQLSIEQKLNEKEGEKEIFSYITNRLNNILNDNNSPKEKKSRNIQNYFNNNLTSASNMNNHTNKSCSNNAINRFNKNRGNNNDFLMNNKNKYNQTYIIVKNKGKDFSPGGNKSDAIRNQKKTIVSRNYVPSIIFKARPNTILKEGFFQSLLFFRKNNLICNSMEQKKKNKKILNDNFNKKSFPNITNLKNLNRHKKLKTNESHLEVNEINLKNDKNKVMVQSEKWNKSQNNLNRIKIRLNSTNLKKVRNKIKKKNYIINENKKTKEKSKLNITNYIYNNIIEKFNNKKEKENEEKKESITKKVGGKKNLSKKFPLSNNDSTPKGKSKIKINNQIKKIIYKPNITQKIDKKMLANLNNSKTTNINICINEFNNSFNIKSNKNIKSRNNMNAETSRTKNNQNYKTYFKITVEKRKIPNMKQNNRIIQQKNRLNKLTPNKKISKNPLINNSNAHDNNTIKNANNNLNYNYVLNNFQINKEKILQNINNNNNLNDLGNKPLNINIINNTCIYIKPKQSKCGLKNNSRNERIKSDLLQINYTQRPIMRKKKPIIQIAK